MKYTVEEKNARHAKVCEKLGWQVHIDGDSGYIENWSRLEDIVVEFSSNTFCEDIIACSEGFNIDEHAAERIAYEWNAHTNKHTVLPSVMALALDAERIADMLDELADALANEKHLIAEEEENEDDE